MRCSWKVRRSPRTDERGAARPARLTPRKVQARSPDRKRLLRDRLEGHGTRSSAASLRLKVAHPEFVAEVGREELEHEAQIGARLQHPNIVAVRNADWIGRSFVIACDLAERCLADYPGARRSGAIALRVVRDTAAGLAHAHSERVLHRDVKPENILIFKDGRAALSDFGVSRFARGCDEDLHRGRNARVHGARAGLRATEAQLGRVLARTDRVRAADGQSSRPGPSSGPGRATSASRGACRSRIRPVLEKAASFEPMARYAERGGVPRSSRRGVREGRGPAAPPHGAPTQTATAAAAFAALRRGGAVPPPVRSEARHALPLPPLRGPDRGEHARLPVVRKRRELVPRDHQLPPLLPGVRARRSRRVVALSVVLMRDASSRTGAHLVPTRRPSAAAARRAATASCSPSCATAPAASRSRSAPGTHRRAERTAAPAAGGPSRRPGGATAPGAGATSRARERSAQSAEARRCAAEPRPEPPVRRGAPRRDDASRRKAISHGARQGCDRRSRRPGGDSSILGRHAIAHLVVLPALREPRPRRHAPPGLREGRCAAPRAARDEPGRSGGLRLPPRAESRRPVGRRAQRGRQRLGWAKRWHPASRPRRAWLPRSSTSWSIAGSSTTTSAWPPTGPSSHRPGKEAITVRQVLSHQSGLYHIRQMVDRAERMLDWEYMIRAIEETEPAHPAGRSGPATTG